MLRNLLNYVPNSSGDSQYLGSGDKDKTLIVDGCSMAGQWNENGNGEGGDIGLYFSEKWDFNRIGLNFPGKSNCSIFRDTTTFLLNSCGKYTLSYENLFLIIEWTGLARYSYFNREKMAWDVYHVWKYDPDGSGKHKTHPGINMDYHSIIEEYMNRFLYQISIANLCENLGVNYIMYNGIDDILSYRDLENTADPSVLVKKIKTYLDIKRDGYVHNVYEDFDNLYEVLSTKNFLDIPCTGYFGYETGRYKMDKDGLKKHTFDGLHLNKLGYQEWAKVLEDFIIDKGMGDFIK